MGYWWICCTAAYTSPPIYHDFTRIIVNTLDIGNIERESAREDIYSDFNNPYSTMGYR